MRFSLKNDVTFLLYDSLEIEVHTMIKSSAYVYGEGVHNLDPFGLQKLFFLSQSLRSLFFFSFQSNRVTS